MKQVSGGEIQTLSVDEIVKIHDALVQDFAEADDPISPAGIKSLSLLESAVNRQDVGYRGVRKYNTPILNAATLVFGICCNHSFHNGNTDLCAG